MTIIAVTGLKREARIVAGPGVKAISCGGRQPGLERKLKAAIGDGAQGIISVGICGGLSPGLAPGTCVIASEIVTKIERIRPDSAWTARLRARLPHAIAGPIASGDGLILGKAGKADLFAQTGAYAVDMESHVAARLARLHSVPFAALRTIADPATSDLPAVAALAVTEDGGLDLLAVLKAVAVQPNQIPALIRTARNANSAFRALLRCRNMLGFGLAGPDVSELALDMR